jgi:ribosome biogenesis SPOUT family RNA methylase Rps3
MKIPIPGIRPNVLSEESYLVLGELMGFRHVFRHAYNYNLTPDKMEILRKKILEKKTSIDSDINIFKQFLEEGFSIK